MNFSDLNTLGRQRKPFLFISDFKAQKLEVILLEDLENEDIEFCIDENYKYNKHSHYLKTNPIKFQNYQEKFNKVIEKIKSGETYILNLTLANAHYKLRFKDKFVCFSPEKFVQINAEKIHTYPMKGTIDASLPNAKEQILNDAKEMAEHIMVVDLLRNDLSIVSRNVKVEEFRYITEIEALELF